METTQSMDMWYGLSNVTELKKNEEERCHLKEKWWVFETQGISVCWHIHYISRLAIVFFFSIEQKAAWSQSESHVAWYSQYWSSNNT